MIGMLLGAVAGFVTGLVMIRVSAHNPLIGVIWFGANSLVCCAIAAWSVVTAGWPEAAWMTFLAALNAWFAYGCWKRHKRKRTAALAGAKSRARIAVLVRKAREAARPRPVLRPVPGGSV